MICCILLFLETLGDAKCKVCDANKLEIYVLSVESVIPIHSMHVIFLLMKVEDEHVAT